MKQNSSLVQSQRDKKMCEKANRSLNQAPPGLTPYALTTQPLPPLLLTVHYFWFINGFLGIV